MQTWVASHRRQVDAYKAGDYPGAVAQALGTDTGASGAQFAVVETSLRDAIEQSRTTMRGYVSDAGRFLAFAPDGRLAAEYVNRAPDGRVYHLGWSRYLGPEEGEALLAAMRGQGCRAGSAPGSGP